jgi:hypothetical protein
MHHGLAPPRSRGNHESIRIGFGGSGRSEFRGNSHRESKRDVQISQQCTSGSSSNCGQWQVTNTYQCAGNTQNGDVYQPVVTTVNPAGTAR